MSRPLRVQYRERQRLRTSDLRDEQNYLLGLSGRHNVGVHTWGIVKGLNVVFSDWTVTVFPGLAVDGFGRVLVVTDSLTFEVEHDKPIEKRVYAHYCQRPLGGCGSGSNTAWDDYAKILITDEKLEPASDIPQLDQSRASGQPDEPSLWPVLLATIKAVPDGNNEFNFQSDVTDCEFTSLIASRIVAPYGSSFVRVGKERLADRYPFRISVRNSTDSRDRFSVDTEGNLQIRGDLVVTAAALEDTVLAFPMAQVVFSPSREFGSNLTRKLTTYDDNDKTVFVVEFRDSLGEIQQTNVSFEPSTNELQASVGLERQPLLTSFSVNRNPPGQLDPVVGIHTPADTVALATDPNLDKSDISQVRRIADGSEKRLGYGPSVLQLKEAIASPENQPCGCDTKSVSDTPTIPSVAFVAIDQPPKVPTRDIYTFKTNENGRQLESLRIALGNFAEGDLRRHLSVGVRKTIGSPEFVTGLTVRGNGEVEFFGANEDDDNRPEMLIVKGTLTLPPVKPDPRDRLFKSLLQLTFLAGVLSHGSSSLVASVKTQPALIETNQDWEYELLLTNVGGEDLVNPTGQEMFNAGLQPDNIPDLPIELKNGTPKTVVVHHKGSELPTSATKLVIDVVLGMDFKSDHRKVAAHCKTVGSGIIVAASPTLNFMKFVSVPAGGSFFLIITNAAITTLKIPSKKIKVTIGGVSNLLDLESDQVLPGNTTKTTTKISIPTTGGPFNVEAELEYNWPERSSLSTLKFVNKPKVRKQFSSSIKTDPSPPRPDKPWQYDLKITNTSGLEIVLQRLKIRTYLSNAIPPSFSEFPLEVVLKANQSFLKDKLDGVVGPDGSQAIVDIELTYVREGALWEDVPRTMKESIHS